MFLPHLSIYLSLNVSRKFSSSDAFLIAWHNRVTPKYEDAWCGDTSESEGGARSGDVYGESPGGAASSRRPGYWGRGRGRETSLSRRTDRAVKRDGGAGAMEIDSNSVGEIGVGEMPRSSMVRRGIMDVGNVDAEQCASPVSAGRLAQSPSSTITIMPQSNCSLVMDGKKKSTMMSSRQDSFSSTTSATLASTKPLEKRMSLPRVDTMRCSTDGVSSGGAESGGGGADGGVGEVGPGIFSSVLEELEIPRGERRNLLSNCLLMRGGGEIDNLESDIGDENDTQYDADITGAEDREEGDGRLGQVDIGVVLQEVEVEEEEAEEQEVKEGGVEDETMSESAGDMMAMSTLMRRPAGGGDREGDRGGDGKRRVVEGNEEEEEEEEVEDDGINFQSGHSVDVAMNEYEQCQSETSDTSGEMRSTHNGGKLVIGNRDSEKIMMDTSAMNEMDRLVGGATEVGEEEKSKIVRRKGYATPISPLRYDYASDGDDSKIAVLVARAMRARTCHSDEGEDEDEEEDDLEGESTPSPPSLTEGEDDSLSLDPDALASDVHSFEEDGGGRGPLPSAWTTDEYEGNATSELEDNFKRVLTNAFRSSEDKGGRVASHCMDESAEDSGMAVDGGSRNTERLITITKEARVSSAKGNKGKKKEGDDQIHMHVGGEWKEHRRGRYAEKKRLRQISKDKRLRRAELRSVEKKKVSDRKQSQSIGGSGRRTVSGTGGRRRGKSTVEDRDTSAQVKSDILRIVRFLSKFVNDAEQPDMIMLQSGATRRDQRVLRKLSSMFEVWISFSIVKFIMYILNILDTFLSFYIFLSIDIFSLSLSLSLSLSHYVKN